LSFWEFREVGDKLVVLSPIKLKCPFCGNELKPHHIGSPRRVMNGYAVDIHFKCPNCGFFATFGVPVDEANLELLKKHGGEFFEWWEIEEDEELKRSIKDKLERLGYW